MSKSCLSCDVVSGRREVAGGPIYETDCFHAHQDIAYPIPGCVIVASKRHFKTLADMDERETATFLPTVKAIRKAQADIGIGVVYYFYNEDTRHHFNFWMVPRYPWMARFGKSVEAVRPAMIHARDNLSSEAELALVAQTAERLRAILSTQ